MSNARDHRDDSRWGPLPAIVALIALATALTVGMILIGSAA